MDSLVMLPIFAALSFFTVAVPLWVGSRSEALPELDDPPQKTEMPVSLFAQARQGVNLSPAQRATLKLFEGFGIAALVAALPVFANLMAQSSVNWLDALRTAGATFAVALIMAVWKYLKAQGDSPLLDAAAPSIQDVINKIDAWGGIPNDVKTEVVPNAIAPSMNTGPDVGVTMNPPYPVGSSTITLANTSASTTGDGAAV